MAPTDRMTRRSIALATEVAIRGGLGDAGGYVYAGCFADAIDGKHRPQFPPYWADATTPRTDRPVRFYPKGRPAPYPGPTDVCVELAYGTAFRVSDAIRVF